MNNKLVVWNRSKTPPVSPQTKSGLTRLGLILLASVGIWISMQVMGGASLTTMTRPPQDEPTPEPMYMVLQGQMIPVAAEDVSDCFSGQEDLCDPTRYHRNVYGCVYENPMVVPNALAVCRNSHPGGANDPKEFQEEMSMATDDDTSWMDDEPRLTQVWPES